MMDLVVLEESCQINVRSRKQTPMEDQTEIRMDATKPITKVEVAEVLLVKMTVISVVRIEVMKDA
ncbi:hypothetical protein [Ketobacter sp.]|uniref:hypothetical protein n=1 Tax=Ketobacter sp. TaxID=2083498 RepID=UPI000F18BBEA|nr:hypothetical protein [Ketobacter sp.]RLU01783.1 MAG: hypothetical protein D9N14_01200 [Ketobacter sp.]